MADFGLRMLKAVTLAQERRNSKTRQPSGNYSVFTAVGCHKIARIGLEGRGSAQ